ncbi:peptide deformylase [Pseudoalteromonas phenolica]|uniref:Peptide deformylase n=1 Tax=Pseudoalteromonas phenolica TaxID=161398 RepID=A0A0S2JYS4_9GAMM|nr:peptide deformylase [Pseudoalteromonas phenolica]ALO41160.1 Peptide deformylase [Pseudoalteromonas phenolica]MBE0354307.1 peptide deformylase [Pseudoalteromonas phenolica O-BC30]RXE92280.1 peptide deformylase [Pseudoalteromonas phenolica O-BC30]
MQLTENKKTMIAQLGQPVLKQKALVVEDILADECQNLIKDMMSIVEKAGGVGIAAPQIHHSLRIFIMCSKPNTRYPDAPLMTPTAIINPEIIAASEEIEKGWEGCLSVPSMRGLVPRHQTVTVKYHDAQGLEHENVFTGFIARIFQHEIDHLDGLTFIDRLESMEDLVSESYWYANYATA